jgi:hypothetical protein
MDITIINRFPYWPCSIRITEVAQLEVEIEATRKSLKQLTKELGIGDLEIKFDLDPDYYEYTTSLNVEHELERYRISIIVKLDGTCQLYMFKDDNFIGDSNSFTFPLVKQTNKSSKKKK